MLILMRAGPELTRGSRHLDFDECLLSVDVMSARESLRENTHSLECQMEYP